MGFMLHDDKDGLKLPIQIFFFNAKLFLRLYFQKGIRQSSSIEIYGIILLIYQNFVCNLFALNSNL